MLETDTIAKSLFEKIRSKFEDVSVGDENTKATIDPSKGRFFNFDYSDSHGKDFGNIAISIVDGNNLKIMYSRNISANMDEQQKAEWYDFLRDMRMFAKRNQMSFNPHDISRKGLGIKDLQQISVTDKPKDASDATVSEGKMYGSTKTSYESIAPGTRLIIRHSASVDESVHGARSRKIQSVYVEDAEGQRFKMPFTHLGGARALAQHVAHGGQINDDFGSHTAGLVQEMAKIRKFIQGSRNKTFEDHEATDMVQAAKERYHTIHHILHKISGSRGYSVYKESWAPEVNEDDDIDLDSMRSKFTQKNFDTRLEDALPHVYKAYNTMKKTTIESMVNEYADELDQISEGTWALPQDDMAIQKLQELMSKRLEAGVDGNNATSALYDILGDDRLFDRIYDASIGSPDMDVRPIVYDWLMTNLPDIGKRVEANMGQAEQQQPQQDTGQEEPTPDEEYQSPNHDSREEWEKDEPEQPQESIQRESTTIVDIRRLAGLR